MGPSKCLVPDCQKQQHIKGYCVKHAKERLDADTWASLKLCIVNGCKETSVLHRYCESHGKIEFGEDRFKALWAQRYCKESGCVAKPVAQGLCFLHGRVRGLDVETMIGKKPARKEGKMRCIEPDCNKQTQIMRYCTSHARKNLDPETFQVAYHASKGCREPGCKKRHAVKAFCLVHARQNLEPDVFQELTKIFKRCKHPGCRRHIGRGGQDDLCAHHKVNHGDDDDDDDDATPGTMAHATIATATTTSANITSDVLVVPEGQETQEGTRTVTVDICQHETLKSEHEALKKEYETLKSEHKILKKEHEALKCEAEKLQHC